jgi:hypothetical protein
LTTGAGTLGAGFKFLRAASSSGWPGLAASCCCCAAKPECAAGGAVRATTGRSNARAGGWPPCAAAPCTLFSVGATGAAKAAGRSAIICGDTLTAALDTGCDCTNAILGTATTAPGTWRFAYTTLPTFALL